MSKNCAAERKPFSEKCLEIASKKLKAERKDTAQLERNCVTKCQINMRKLEKKTEKIFSERNWAECQKYKENRKES